MILSASMIHRRWVATLIAGAAPTSEGPFCGYSKLLAVSSVEFRSSGDVLLSRVVVVISWRQDGLRGSK